MGLILCNDVSWVKNPIICNGKDYGDYNICIVSMYVCLVCTYPQCIIGFKTCTAVLKDVKLRLGIA